MKKTLHSGLSLLLVLILMLSVVQVSAAAQTTPMTITASQKTALPGASVDVDIALKNNPGVSSIGLDVTYNKNVLTLEKISYNTALGGTPQSSDLEANPVKLIWINPTEQFEGDVVFATLSFKVKTTAKSGAYSDITLSYDEEDIYNLAENNIACSVENGKVTVVENIAGDINDDSKVNNKDVSRLMQYHAGWKVTVNTPVLDVNGDTKLNNKDVTRLMQYLAGWKVDIHPVPEDHGGEIEECNHQSNKVDAKVPSCSQEGHKAYWQCSVCGKKFSDSRCTTEVKDADLVIPKTEHHIVIDPAVAPTATSEGKTEGSHCSVCGEVIIAQETIPVLQGDTYPIIYHLYADDTYLQKIGVKNPNLATYNSQTGLRLQNVKVDGYIFEGWYDGEGANGELVKTIPAGMTGEIELYAKWTPREYTITFNSPLVPVASKKYHVNTGATLTNPSLNGYNFIGWCDENDKLVTNIPVGTTGNITLYANWTSKRNQTRPVSHLDDPLIFEDADKGNIMFAYEIGTIENVPMQTLSQTYQSIGGMKQTYTTQESVTVTKGEAQNIAKTVSNSTTDSKAWTLSEDWNDVTSVSETYATEKGWTKEEAEEYSKTSGNTYSVNSSSGGSHTQTSSAGLSGTVSKSNSDTAGGSISRERETGSEYEISKKTTTGSEMSAGIGLDFVSAGGKISSGKEVNESEKNYEHNKSSASLNFSSTGTKSNSVTGESSNADTGTSTWNTSSGYSSSSSTSQTQSVRNVLSEVVSETKGYGSSYSRGGSKSDTQSFTNTAAESDQYSSAITFSEGTVKTETKSIELGGENEGYYRFVLAGMAHVFAVVGYDVSTSSYYTFTYTVMDDETYTFIDYSKTTAAFNDNENGVLPFEVPYFVKEYVDARIMQTGGLSVSQEGVVTNYTGTDDIVFIPAYYRMDNLDGTHTSIKITGISPDAFAGKEIKAISLSNFIKEIPSSAFKNCTDLEAILCPGVTKIQSYAFKGCASLREFNIPSSLEVLGKQAFEGINKLTVEASSKEVANGAILSGANQLVLNISSNPAAMENAEFVVPSSITYFELRGNAKDYKNLKIKSDAETTVINGLNMTCTSGTPLDISSENVVLNRVNVNSKGYAALLKNEETNIKLYGSVRLNSENGKAIVCRNINLTEVDPSISSWLSVSGNILICGKIEGQNLLSIANGSIVQISDEEFDKYVRGCYEVTFNPNGGKVATASKAIYYGDKYGDLPVATKDYCNFLGWFTAVNSGKKITKDTVFEGSDDITLYAHWETKSTSDWTLASALPSGAKVVEEEWRYTKTETTTSDKSSMNGWECYDSKQNYGEYGGWSGWSTSYVSGSNTRQVETRQYEWCTIEGNCCGNRQGNRCYLKYMQDGYTLRLHYSARTISREELNTWQTLSEGSWYNYATNVQGYIIGPGTAYIDPYEHVPYFLMNSWNETQYRYRDRSESTTYYYRRTLELTASYNPSGETGVSNVMKYVKYIEK